jgi:hypothetical protein
VEAKDSIHPRHRAGRYTDRRVRRRHTGVRNP